MNERKSERTNQSHLNIPPKSTPYTIIIPIDRNTHYAITITIIIIYSNAPTGYKKRETLQLQPSTPSSLQTISITQVKAEVQCIPPPQYQLTQIIIPSRLHDLLKPRLSLFKSISNPIPTVILPLPLPSPSLPPTSFHQTPPTPLPKLPRHLLTIQLPLLIRPLQRQQFRNTSRVQGGAFGD